MAERNKVMEGYIKIDVADGGVGVEVSVKNVGIMDKLMLLHSFCSALEMDDEDIFAMMLARKMFDENSQKITVDGSMLAALKNGGLDTDDDGEEVED